jgi:anti-anti-sigma factor
MLAPVGTEDGLLEVTRERREAAVVVAVCGEIDLSTSPDLRAVLHDPETRGELVVLDLRGVEFMDSSGLGLIVGQHKRAREDGFRFQVAVAKDSEVERILELSGLVSVLEFADASDGHLGA